MILYIDGPIRGVSDFEKKFADAKQKLESVGHETMSVLDCSILNNEHFDWSDRMKFCIEMLEKCDGIVLLSGWKTSVRATIEKAWAEKLGKPIYYFQSSERVC